jgi:hypothetical protein
LQKVEQRDVYRCHIMRYHRKCRYDPVCPIVAKCRNEKDLSSPPKMLWPHTTLTLLAFTSFILLEYKPTTHQIN